MIDQSNNLSVSCSRYKKDPNNIRATWYAEKSKKIFAEKINTG